MKISTFKKILIIILVIALSGCTNNKQTDTGESEQLDVQELEMLSYSISKISNEEDRYINLDSWKSFIKNTFNIDIKISYMSSNIEEALLQAQTLDGLVYFTDYQVFYNFIDANLLEPLNNYNLQTFYEADHINALSINSVNYGLPAYGVYYNEKARFYDKNFMTENNLSNINTIDEFYKTLKLYSNSKLDSEQFAFQLNVYSIGDEICDIQNAFGCYFSRNSINHQVFDTSISYNPNTGIFEDSALSENIFSYLGFLKTLVDENIISITEEFNPYNGEYNPMTFWGQVITYMDNPNYILDSYYLLGTNDKNLYERKYYPKFYGVLKNTENINKYVDFLTERYYTNTDFKLALVAGLPEVDYKVINDIIVKYELSGESLGFWIPSNDYFLFSKTENTNPSTISKYLGYREKLPQLTDYVNNINKKLSYVTPFTFTNAFVSYKSIITDSNFLDFDNNVLKPIFIDGVDIDTAVEQYRMQVKKSGLDKHLIFVNESILKVDSGNPN